MVQPQFKVELESVYAPNEQRGRAISWGRKRLTDETKRTMQFILENSEQLILLDTYFLFLYDIYYFSLIRQSISYPITQWNNRYINNL